MFLLYSLCLLHLKEAGLCYLSFLHGYFPSSFPKYLLWKTTFGMLKVINQEVIADYFRGKQMAATK